MRKNDPMKRLYWVFFIFEGFVLIMFLLMAILSIATGRPNYFLIGYPIFLAVLLIFVFFTFKRRHQRTEERRQRALSGDSAFLAQPQPIPDVQAVPLPAKVGLRISFKRMFGFTSALCLVIVIAGFVGFIVAQLTEEDGQTTDALDVSSFIIPTLIGLAVFVLVLFLVSFLIIYFLRSWYEQEVMLDEQGISTKFYRKITRIPWNEVQSFAIWGNAKRFSTIQFEVTSDHGVARWFQLGSPRKPLTWLTMLRPDMPYEEYQTKIAAIQQIIVARTGKSLYDLRDEKIVWW